MALLALPERLTQATDSPARKRLRMDKLHRIKGAWPYLIAVFLNAFVYLGHKIVIQNTVFKVYDGSTQVVLTALVNGMMLLPFILLFSPSGHVAVSI